MGTRLVTCALIITVTLLASGCGGGSGGATNVEIVHDFYRSDPTDDEKVVNVPCPSGKIALGGGFELAARDFPIDVQYSEPMGLGRPGADRVAGLRTRNDAD